MFVEEWSHEIQPLVLQEARENSEEIQISLEREEHLKGVFVAMLQGLMDRAWNPIQYVKLRKAKQRVENTSGAFDALTRKKLHGKLVSVSASGFENSRGEYMDEDKWGRKIYKISYAVEGVKGAVISIEASLSNEQILQVRLGNPIEVDADGRGNVLKMVIGDQEVTIVRPEDFPDEFVT